VPITLDATSNSDGVTTTSSQITFAATVNSGSDRLLTASFSARDGAAFTSATWNTSESMTKAVELVATNGLVASIWYLINPTATSANIVGNTSGQTWIGGTAVSLFGVAQSSPVDDTDTVETSGTDPSFSALTTATDGCAVIDCLTTNGATLGDVAITAETNRVLRAKFVGSNGSPNDGRVVGVSSVITKSPAGSLTLQWTITGLSSSLVAVAFKPAVVAASTMGYLKPNNLRPRIFSPGLAR
jgi:hypothetical protein